MNISSNINILTAIDIDTNKISIQSQIDTNVKTFVKGRLRKKLKELREELKIKFRDDVEKQIVSKKDAESITITLLHDDETKLFRENQKNILKTKNENYGILRQTLEDLNDINEFSSEIERNKIQTIDNLLTYRKLLDLSYEKLNLYNSIVDIRERNISEYVEVFSDKNIETSESRMLQFLINMRELYNIDKTIDDIDLYEKFGMESNIDMSNSLGEICFKRVTQNEINTNIINDLATPTNNITKLVGSKIIGNKLLGLFLSQTEFITNNKTTCLKSTYVTDDNNKLIYTTRTLGELLFEITNSEYQYLTKDQRQQIYTTYEGSRPKGFEYYKWNGLQIYDIDLKEWDGDIDLLKRTLFSYLCDFRWFLWICKSSSGKGLHIYTKVAPPHHVYIKPTDNEYLLKYWFIVNYMTKVSIIYDILYRLNKDIESPIKFSDKYIDESGFENVFVDNVVSRITAGIRLPYDNMPLVNPNFMDLHIGLNLIQGFDGFSYEKAINELFLRDTKINQNFIERVEDFRQYDKVEEKIDLSKFVTLGGDIEKIKPLNRSNINYVTRYNVCNALASLFGKEGVSIAHSILDSKLCGNVNEINSFYSCALTNKKQPSKLGLDILRKQGVIKSIDPEVKKQGDNIYKEYIKNLIEKSKENPFEPKKLILNDGEYLSDKQDYLLNPLEGGIIHDKINIITSPPGSGKTEWIKTLARSGKRIMLVLPYISVIKNKVETDVELMEIFDAYYGTKNIKDIEYGINVVTTFDKFSQSNYEKVSKMFDYIFIDESHLLFTSSYRIEATSNVIKKLKELYYIVSNDKFAAHLCLMTGTETGESFFFSKVSNHITVDKKMQNKEMEFLICDDILDSITRLADRVHNLIVDGYKILIPTNKGEIYSEKIIGMVEHLLGRDVKYGYYKRSNTEQEICRLINDSNTVGKYEIIFCSNYLSVGVDINDNTKFASVYLGPFSGFEVEQFNSRIRRTGIKSIYCVQTQTSDGSTSDILLEEPNLLLRVTEEDAENFADDKSIASAKQEFVASYDPILHKITTPGFSYLHGKIRFNLEEYELLSFENKYIECMQHPIKVARELSIYGYSIKVSTEFDGLSIDQQEELKAIGIKAAKMERLRKHSLLIGTFIDLINKNTHSNEHGLEFTDVIGWIGKNSDKIFEDREQEDYIIIKFDIFSTPVSVTVKSKEALDVMFKPAKYLISKYSITKILSILDQYVDDQGILKQKQFKRAINLLKLIDSSDANELTEPLTKTIEKIYDFVDQFEMNKNYKIDYYSYQSTIETWTNEYLDMLGIHINTIYGFEKIKDSLMELLYDIATKSTSKNGIRFVYNKLPDQDSNQINNRRSVDSLITKMFDISTKIIVETKPRQKHILLTDQAL